MIGREQLMVGIINELTKTSPSHRSIVGARYMGKSVLLTELAKRMRGGGSPYCAVIEWDLGHSTPQSDEEFLKALSSRLGHGLLGAGQEVYGDHLKSVDADYYSEICAVIDSMHRDELRVLMIWDGFDKPLSAGTLTRNLWDNLRELCLKESFRLVTATRRELHELIRDEKSVTSDFWNIFGDIVRIGPLTDTDLNAILSTLSEYAFESGARTELMNWTGCNPPLLLALLNAICMTKPSGNVSNQDVNAAADVALAQLEPILSVLWTDCSPSTKDLYGALTDCREMPLGESSRADREQLVEKAFAVVSGQKLIIACRLLERTIQGAGPDAGSMARLFGDWQGYKSNISAMLERRLAQVHPFDQRLYRFVEIAIGLLKDDPESALNNLTSIEERSLDVVWKRECDDGRTFSDAVVKHWTATSRNTNRIVSDMMNTNRFEVPTDRWKQLGVLQLLTGSSNGFDPVARCTSKDTYVLLNAIHSFRNRNQHADGQEIHLGVAVAALMTCVELLACLCREGSASSDKQGSEITPIADRLESNTAAMS